MATMRTLLQFITPEIAANFLTHNVVNRPIRMNWVHELAAMLINGEFLLHHQGICFDVNGNLSDGQHRLLAIIESNTGAWLNVTYDAPVEGVVGVDVGKKRNYADILHLGKCHASFLTHSYRVLISTRTNPRVSDLQKLNTILGPTIEDLLNYAPSFSKFYSSNPIKFAAVLRARAGGNRDYIFPLYRNLTLIDIENLPPIARSLIKQKETGTIPVAVSTRDFSFQARCWILFDERRKNSKVLLSGDTTRTMQEIRDVYNSLTP